MSLDNSSALKKALAVNLDASIYGTFAEIGAGQEVARWFFQAGKASQTIAKTISAYDMTFSDSIYGKAERYVCESRVKQMLDHEYGLLEERLGAKRRSSTRFFAFADTVATSSQDEATAKCHGWMGIRFQLKPAGPAHEIILHVRMLDRTRLMQQEALGILGVNLVHLAFNLPKDSGAVVEALVSGLGAQRIEINALTLAGPDLRRFDNRLLSLQLVHHGVTEAVVFAPNGQMANPSDIFFRKDIVVLRGAFRPVTRINQLLLERGIEQIHNLQKAAASPIGCFEITMSSLLEGGSLDDADFLERVDLLTSLGHFVMLSNFNYFYQVKSFLRVYTDRTVAIIIGASHLEKLFDPAAYRGLKGGLLEGFSRLFDEKSQIFVFPYKTGNHCLTTKVFNPEKSLTHLYRHFVENGSIRDMTNCDDVETSIHSRDVRQMLADGEKKWESYVPPVVAEAIKTRRLFGYKG